MGGTKSDLVGMFTNAVDAFNKHNINNLAQYLDDQVIVYANSDHKGNHPKAVALSYLQAQFADNPSFTLPNSIPAVINANGTGGVIQGTTTWKDNNGKEDLLYSFTFVFKNGQWLFSTMWGA